MKKNKTSLGISSFSSSLSSLSDSRLKIDAEVLQLQQGSKERDIETLTRKNIILEKQNSLLKQSNKYMQKELDLYRKLVLTKNNGSQKKDIVKKNSLLGNVSDSTIQSPNKVELHQILEFQQQKIFQLQTQLSVLQNKYDRILSSSGSDKQTQYAVKCKQLENIVRNKEIQYQKQISALKAKLMRMNASQIVSGGTNSGLTQNGTSLGSMMNNANTMTPIKNTRKLV